ncbi:Hypothetical protein A7982_07554 [Minicystis rosea]|nr:Hypothetical protein A7982_07554 [Minicystis rosea]
MESCGWCPDGLLEQELQVRCADTCGGPTTLETCGHCPDGTFDVEQGALVDCVEHCGGSVLATICTNDQLCPVGAFRSDVCAGLACVPDEHACVLACGGEVVDVLCEPCASSAYVDRDDCPIGGGA